MSNFITACRTLWKSPAFSIVAVLTIAVAIGANSALFSIYDRLVLNPVTIPQTASLVAIWAKNAKLNLNAPAISWPHYQAIAAQTTSFSSVGVSAFDNFTLTGNGDPEQLNGLRVSASFLPTLGILPALGRNFSEAEDLPNGPAVCIISHELWQTRFGSRASILGNTITLNTRSWEVIGVMPPRLSPPFNQVQVFAPRVFEVSGLTPTQVQNGAGYSQPIARLRRGVSLAQATSDLAAVDRGYREEFATRLDANNATEPRMFVEALVGNLEPTFYTLLGAVSFVLLIACANVASLFLSRLTTRQKEVAVRQAIGATQAQVVRQFLVESVVFSTIAGLLGTLLALWALSGIRSIIASQLPPGTVLTLNWRALAFTGTVTLLTSLLVGLAPAFHASRAPLVDALKDGARGSSSDRGGRFRSALVVGEVALSVVLLVGSTLLLVSFLQLQRTPPGFEPHGAAAAYVGVPLTRYTTPVQQARFFSQVIDVLHANPEVVDAAAALGLPLTGFNPRSPYGVGGRAIEPLPQRPIANLAIVSETYFDVLRITMAAGRAFTANDRDGSPPVCIVNETLAKRLFPGESALGHIMLRGKNADIRAEIVGVIRDVRTSGLNVPAPDEIYYPMRQLGQPGMLLVARTAGDPAALQGAVRRAVAEVDKEQPISLFTTLDTTVANSLGVQRIVSTLTAIFAALALIMSAVGLYSVLAYAVSQRTSEIGIRMALGARASQVIGLVMRNGLAFVGLGLVLGLGAAAGAARLIQSLLVDVHPLDPRVYLGVSVLFLVVAALACLVPSLRAARIDPIRALRDS
jgi:predicted permease